MKRNGFTLIELLAVITILAIIVLITIPAVSNTIKKAEQGSAERSTENYIRAVETALAVSKMEGNKLEDEYTLDNDGNLCPVNETCTNENKIMVDTKGNKPTSGTLYISDGKVTVGSIITMGEYKVSYDSNNKLVATKIGENGPITLSEICTYKGTDVSKKYELGSEYECDPGDGVKRTFYVLEDGDTTTLTKTDGSIHYAGDKVGTANKGEISLIMHKDIGLSPYITLEDYKNSGGECTEYEGNCVYIGIDSRFGPITANNYLKSETVGKGWKTEVYLPTYDQIYAVNNSPSLASITWLLDDSECEDGYWVSTSNGNNFYAWMVLLQGYYELTDGFYDAAMAVGIRPVITVTK